jgi:predicted nucleic acid-binding protein
MSERLAVDANLAIEIIRDNRVPQPLEIQRAEKIFLPLPALGELLAGVYSSRYVEENLSILQDLIKTWTVVVPDEETAYFYGRTRASLREMPRATQSRLNDLWIAALCIQHDLPLFTSDHGFDVIEGLTVIHR